MDLGSVNAPPPLDHRQSGVGWSSDKLQAASLTAGPGYDRMNLESEKYMTETKKLKEMLSQGWKEIRASKNKTWPRFGIEMFLLQCIIQCNKALNEKKEENHE